MLADYAPELRGVGTFELDVAISVQCGLQLDAEVGKRRFLAVLSA